MKFQLVAAATHVARHARRNVPLLLAFLLLVALGLSPALAQQGQPPNPAVSPQMQIPASTTPEPVPEHHAGGEANLKLPDLDQAQFLNGIGGRSLLMFGLFVGALGLVFGLVIYKQLENMPVHKSMLEISELMYVLQVS